MILLRGAGSCNFSSGGSVAGGLARGHDGWSLRGVWMPRWSCAFMFVPTTFAVALLMTILSTVCWGSFANTFKGTRNYPFDLYYWDYGLGIFLISLVLALTMGSFHGGPTAFLANVHTADNINLFYAALGGFIFNIANVLLVAGIEIVGLAVAFPISIGIALVEGVVLSY